jgi:hypothetical protein
MISDHRCGTFTLDGVFGPTSMAGAFWRASPEGVKAALEGGGLRGLRS